MFSWSNWGGSITSSFSRICVFVCVGGGGGGGAHADAVREARPLYVYN